MHHSGKTRLRLEWLEDRTLLNGYWANGERIDLVERTDQYVIKVAGPDPENVLSDLTAGNGPLAGFQVTEAVAPKVWLLDRTTAAGENPKPIDTTRSTPPGIDWLTASFTNAATQGRVLVIDELVVGLQAGVNFREFFVALSDTLGAFEYRALLGTPDQFVVTLVGKAGDATLNAADRLTNDARVRFAAPNLYHNFERLFTPNDTLFAQQWHLNNNGAQVADAIAGADVKAVAAWDISTGTGVTIAVVDDGMERTHPDLVDNIFVNPGEIAGNSIDDDGNGFVDDVSGWSFVTNGPNPSVTSSDAHATSVAGVAAGKGNNNLGVAGSAFNARILPVQIFNGNSFVGEAGAASAIYYAAGRTANGLGTWNAAQVINCSWGGGSPSTVITNALTWANNTARAGRGVPSFISSGNGYFSSVSYPANLSATLNGVMAVGASNQRDLRSEYSSYGTALDFVSPSSDIDTPFTVGITTTDRTGSLGYNTGDYTNNTVGNGFGGTSSAAPLAAGVGALLLSVNPNLTAAQVKQVLRATADKVGGVAYDANGFHIEYGYGRINAFAALQSLSMQVIGAIPVNGSVVFSIPAATGGYRADFNFPYDQDAVDIDLTKVKVNGISPSSFTVLDADSLQFNFAASPVTAEGLQTFTIEAGAVKRLSNGELVGAYAGSFRYDALALQVASTAPAVGSVVLLPFTVLDVNLNEPVLPSSVGNTDLLLSQGAVSGFSLRNGNQTIRFNLSGITSEATLTARIAAGALTDVVGNPNLPFSGSYTLDFATISYPTTLTAKPPLGSLVYDAGVPGAITPAGDTDSFTLSLDIGQQITLVLDPAQSLQGTVQLFNPSSTLIGTGTSAAAGQDAVVQNIAIIAAGTYTITVSGAGGTSGAYTLQAVLNAREEAERHGGPSNNSFATAENVDASFLSLGGAVARGAVLGATDTVSGYSAAAVAPTVQDIGATGTRSTGAVGDDGTDTLTAVQLAGFTFAFYGTTYTSLSFSTNGLITFGAANGAFTNTDLSTSPAEAVIAVLWDDLFIENTGTGAASRAILWQVIGAGASQQLVIQWNNARQFGGSAYFTFQAVLSLDGAIQLNYASTVTSAVVSSATVGVKAAGTSNPQRLLVSFDQAPGALVGPSLSTAFTLPPPSSDHYSFTLNTGDSATLALKAVPTGTLSLALLDSSGALLAQGLGGSSNLDAVIRDYVAPATGVYQARVSAGTILDYQLIVTRNAGFETESNDTILTAQYLGGADGVLGYGGGRVFFVYDATANLIRKCDPVTGAIIDSFAAPVVPASGPDFGLATTNTSLLVAGLSTSAIFELDPSTGATLRTITNPSVGVSGLAFLNNEIFLLTDAIPGQITVLDYASGAVKRTITTTPGIVNEGLGASTTALLGTDGANLYQINIASGASTSLGTLAGTSYSEGLGVVGNELFIADFDVVRVYDLNSLALRRTLSGFNDLEAVGADGAGVALPDWYSFAVNAGDNLILQSSTPADGAGEFGNTFNPKLELYNPGDVLVVSGVVQADGRNEMLSHTALATGLYRLRVLNEGGTSGEYFVSLSNNTGNPVLPFQVTTTTPANAALLRVAPTRITINFNDAVLLTSLQRGDLRVDGVDATSFTVVDGDTVDFTIAGSLGEGAHTVTIAAGAITDLQGTPLQASSGTFTLDLTGPRVTATSLAANGVAAPGALSYQLTFNEAMLVANLSADDFTLRGNARALDYTPNSFSFNAGGTVLTLNYASLPDDNYTLTLLSGASGGSNFTDVAGNALDGEFSGAFPSGNATPGGSFVVGFNLDLATEALPTPLTATLPLGSRIYDSALTRVIAFAGDVDRFTVSLDPGQTVTVLVTANSAGLQPSVELLDPSSASMGVATAAAAGQNALLPTVAITTGGQYTVRVNGVGASTGLYTAKVTLNAAIEREGRIAGVTNDTTTTAQDLAGSFTTEQTFQRAAVLGAIDLSGGYSVAAVAPTLQDISTTGTRSIGAVGDEGTGTLTAAQLAGFAFAFYGTTYTSLSFSTNGLITFGGANSEYSNTDLSTFPAEAAIAVLWDDLFIENSGTGSASRAIFWQVIGAGASQQFVVQWNNARQFGGSAYFTFQAVLSRDGAIQLNYAPTLTSTVVSSATVGVKAPGTSNPPRLVVSFNQAPGALVGPNLSTRFSVIPPPPDTYSFTLAAGDRTTLGLTALNPGNVNVELLDPNAAPIATGSAGATNLSKLINLFNVTAAGTYYARVSGDGGAPYSLLVTRNSALDSEANDTFATAQNIGSSRGVLGTITAASDAIDVTDTSSFRLETSTPADGANQFVNTLNPHIELYNPSNALVAVGVALPDGRNEAIQFAPPATGSYRVRVIGDSGTSGEYFLSRTPIADQPPTISDIPNQTIAEDTATTTLTFTINDVETPPASLSVNGTSSNLTLVPNANIVFGGSGNSRTVTVTPAADQFGTATITITVTDGGGLTAVDTLVLTVTEVNDAPTGVNDTLSSIAEDSVARTIGFAALLANDLKGPANESTQTLTITAVSNGIGGTPTVVGTDVIFTPAADFNGAAGFTYTLQDNGTTNGGADPKTSTATVSFNITEVNDAPSGVNDALSSIAEDSGARTITFASLLANDSKGPANESAQTLTITAASNASGGTVAVVGTDVVFTPAADYNGPAGFTYTLQDNGATNGVADPKTSTATVSFTITEVNDAPTGVNDALSDIAQGSPPRTIPFTALLGNDSKGPANESGQSLTITNVGSATGGTVAINGTDVIFTLQAGYAGPASFTYTLQDNGTTNGVADPKTSTATVSFTIVSGNTPPTISDIPNQTIAEDTPTGAIAFTINDVETPPASLSVSGTSSNLTLVPNANIVFGGSGNSRTVTITPAADQFGTATITITVADGGNVTAVDTFVLTVTEVNDAPTGADDALSSIAEDSGARTISFASLLANDSKGPANESTQTLTLTAVSNASGGSVAIVATDVVFTPAADFNGAASFTYTLQDNGTTNGGADPKSSTATVSFTITEVNDAPSGVNDALSSSAEDAGARTISFASLLANDSKGPANESGQTLTITGVGNASGGTVAIVGTDVIFTPAPDFNGAAGFSYTLQDNGTTNGVADPKTSTASVSFTITEVNDAPTGVNDTLTPVAEDSPPRTISFASLLANDVKGPANESGQTLTITAVGNVVGGTASIAGTDVIFTPAANYNGQASFEYTLRDDGTTNGASDFKTSTAMASFNVTEVNDPPTGVADPLTSVAEDSPPRTISFASLLANDLKGPANESGQTLTIIEVKNPVGGAVSIAGADVVFTLTADYNGPAGFEYALQDDGTTNGVADPKTSTALVSFTVTEVNDPPTGVDDSLTSVAEDSAPRTISFASLLANDLKGPANEGAQTLTITGVKNAVGGTVAIVGTDVVFTLTPDYNGPAAFEYTLQDNGTTNGTPDAKTGTATASFTVTEVNDAPTGVNDALSSVAEDSGARTITVASLLANDSKGPANESAQTLTITAVSNASGGSVAIVGTDVVFTPAADFNGAASFTYTLQDNGTTNGVADPKTGTATVSFTITEVNDAPTGVNDALGNIAEDSGARTIPFATLLTNDLNGPANESSQNLTVTSVGNAVGGTATIVGADVIFTPAADFNGTASFQYTLQDDGTTNGAPDFKTSTATASFTITEVNDAPTGVNDTLSNIAEDSGARTIALASLLGNDSKGPANENGQTLTIIGVANASGGTVAIVGTDVIFTPTPDYNGPAGFTYTLQDNGATNGVGDPRTSMATVGFTITEVNDAPTGVNDTLANVAEDSPPRTIAFATLLANDLKGPAIENSQTLTITSVSNGVGGTAAIIGTDVIFTLTPDYSGPAGFTYTLQDNGTTNGGADPKTSTATVSFTITEVNDPPSGVNDALSSVLEDSGPRTITLASLLANDSKGPANESSQALTITGVSNAVGGTAAIVGTDVIFTLAANYNGPAGFTYTLQDNGATSGVADPRTASATVSFTVTAVNDQPALTDIPDPPAIPENSGPKTLSLSGITAGSGETQTLTVTAISNNKALILDPTVAYASANTTGSLVYAPMPNVSGEAEIVVTVSDDGGAADGGIDKLTRTFKVKVSQAPRPVNFPASATGPAGQFPTGLAVGDFNGDSTDDLAVANYGPTGGNTVSVLMGTGAGTFSGATSTLALPPGTNPFGITTGKFIEGTNALSIVTGNFSGQSVTVFVGNGNGTFKPPQTLPARDSAGGLHKIVQVTTGDLNGDNRQDIVAAGGDGTYTVFLGNGNGTFAPLPTRSALTPIFGVAITTLDTGSGPRASLIVAAFAAHKIAVLPGNGDGTFAAPIFTASGGATNEFLALADFDNDSRIDVATSNKDGATVSVLLGNGNGTFSSVTTYVSGVTPLGITVSD